MDPLTAQPNWTEIVNKKLKFPPPLLGAIQEGRLGLVQQLLEAGVEATFGGPGGPLRNVEEAEDRSWREALNLAIRLGHEAITDMLLANVKFDFRQIHEALLVAVDTNQPAVVRRLLARLDREKGRKVDTRSFSLAFFDSSIDGSRFAPGVTPLTLACQKDLYEIAQLLMEQGHTIARPHPVSCACLECSNARRYDLLKFSLSRINTYRGIASRAHLSLASEDAMLAAFQLSRELRRLARKEPEFKPEYIALESLCQDYGFELLGMCRNQSEVTAVLNDLGEDSETEPETESLGQAFEEGIPNLARLRLAVNYNQKRVSWALSPSLPRCPPNSKHLPCPAPPDASSCSQDLHSEHSCLGACWQEEKASAPPFRLHSPLPVPSPSEDPRTRVTQIPSFTLGQSAFELWLRPAE